eukprot:3941430-Rhodomonas_salina.1
MVLDGNILVLPIRDQWDISRMHTSSTRPLRDRMHAHLHAEEERAHCSPRHADVGNTLWRERVQEGTADESLSSTSNVYCDMIDKAIQIIT